MSRADGDVRSVTKIIDSGSSAVRWDLVILGDGYQAGELAKYEADVAGVVRAMFSTLPFDALQRGINVHRVNVASRESGASNLCTGEQRATFFDSHFCSHRIERLLVTDTRAALEVAIDAVPAMNATLMIVNTEQYGGSGGAVPVFSASPHAVEIALHEMGHSHFGLADEYPSRVDCREAQAHDGLEPGEPNVTVNGAAPKWAHLVTRGTPLPTTRNVNCTDCDRQPNPAGPGTIGAFEGARYLRCGMFRPAFDCRMRELGHTFCAVCQDTIRRVLAPFLPPSRRRAAR